MYSRPHICRAIKERCLFEALPFGALRFGIVMTLTLDAIHHFHTIIGRVTRILLCPYGGWFHPIGTQIRIPNTWTWNAAYELLGVMREQTGSIARACIFRGRTILENRTLFEEGNSSTSVAPRGSFQPLGHRLLL